MLSYQLIFVWDDLHRLTLTLAGIVAGINGVNWMPILSMVIIAIMLLEISYLLVIVIGHFFMDMRAGYQWNSKRRQNKDDRKQNACDMHKRAESHALPQAEARPILWPLVPAGRADYSLETRHAKSEPSFADVR